MSVSISALLGVLFLVLAIVSTYLMFQFWGYPYDKEKRKSEAPQWKMNIHRGVGYAFVIVYIIMMVQMVPRLWTYQVEFPARTVAHFCLGITIGVILLLKISILRWFRHFEEWMPVLGVGLLLCTFLLTGLSLPFVYKERVLANDKAFTQENVARVAKLLPEAGFAEGVDVAELATVKNLGAGREVLLSDCIYCHDLKTAISRPRTPADWVRTVRRMAAKPTLGPILDERKQELVSAYLIAITPDLQKSAKSRRAAAAGKADTIKAMQKLASVDAGALNTGDGGAAAAPPAAKPVDLAKAKEVYEEQCSQCHDLSDVADEPPKSRADVDSVIARMIDNGLEADKEELELIEAYLVATFVEAK